MNNENNPKPKTILVTGGAGFIGTHLVSRLVSEGHQVFSLDNYSTGSKHNHVAGVHYIEGDTKNIAKHVSEIPHVVYHLGEYSRAEQSFEDVAQVLESNVVGTQAVLEFVRTHGCKLIYAGSSTKFADAGIGRDQSPYAWTKATNTELVKNYGEWFELEYAITYFYNVYGKGERGDTKSGTVISIFNELHKKGEPLHVRLPGTQRRNFTHIDDIIEGILLVGERGQGDEYGLGHPDSFSILEVAEMFGSEIVMIPDRPGNRMNSKADVRRAELELGWKPKKNLPEYIKEIIS
jgi:UDP-glucose 4-epimerase